MARPRKDSTKPSARRRIVQAFLDLLLEMPYSEITVSALIRRSEVSPNTLYYHFDSYDDVVRTALDETLDPSFLTLIIAGSSQNDGALTTDLGRRFAYVVRYATDESGKLQALLKATLKEVWLEEMSLDPDGLSQLENLELDFIFAGVVSLLAGMGEDGSMLASGIVGDFFKRPLGGGIMGTLQALALNHAPGLAQE